MIPGEVSLLIDAVLILLLGVVMLYALRLQRALNALRNAKDEMAGLLTTYARATETAEVAIARLKGAASDETKAVREAVSAGEAVRTDLEFLAQRAGQTADRLEQAIRAAREVDLPNPRRMRAETVTDKDTHRETDRRGPALEPGRLRAAAAAAATSASGAHRAEDETGAGRLRLRMGPEEAAGSGRETGMPAEARPGSKGDLLKALQALR
jgi:hypothetical protein